MSLLSFKRHFFILTQKKDQIVFYRINRMLVPKLNWNEYCTFKGGIAIGSKTILALDF
jgi:hypothetical protein